MTETPSARDFKDRRRDPAWERELAKWLRQQPEDKRFAFVMDLVNYQAIVALQLAQKTLVSRDSFGKLLEFAVSNCDASSMKYWLESVVPRLGFRRTVDKLLRLASFDVDGVEKAVYWLPRYANSERDQSKLKELVEEISKQISKNIPPRTT